MPEWLELALYWLAAMALIQVTGVPRAFVIVRRSDWRRRR